MNFTAHFIASSLKMCFFYNRKKKEHRDKSFNKFITALYHHKIPSHSYYQVNSLKVNKIRERETLFLGNKLKEIFY